MADLEFRIGGLKINPEKLKFVGPKPYDSPHKFVVEVIENNASIYVSGGQAHVIVATNFKLNNDRMVGGGSFYLDDNAQLTLNDFSGSYDAIPNEIAGKFMELIRPEVEKLGVEVKGTGVNTDERRLNPFWIERGFVLKPSEEKPIEDVSW